MKRVLVAVLAVWVLGAATAWAQEPVSYRLLATNKTSTMQKEMNEAAEAGYRFSSAMGGDTAIGGSEVVVAMARVSGRGSSNGRFSYRLLATLKTSTMEKELKEAAEAGYVYKGQTVFKTAFGGEEVVVILERNRDDRAPDQDFKLLATKRTGTLQKELNEVGEEGYELLGLTVAKTAMGGEEVVAITRRVKN
jgi:hypothetical protein